MAKAKKMSRASDGQTFLPGTEPEKNAKVHNAALRYIRERDKRIAANQEESDAHNTLLNLMIEQGLESYVYGDLKVFVDSKKKCKVSRESAESGGEGEE